MVVHTLAIVHRSYGLTLFQKNYSNQVGENMGNLQGNWASVARYCDETVQISPSADSNVLSTLGVIIIEGGDRWIHCYGTVNNIYYIFVTDTQDTSVDDLFNQLHLVYVDYVSKNCMLTEQSDLSRVPFFVGCTDEFVAKYNQRKNGPNASPLSTTSSSI